MEKNGDILIKLPDPEVIDAVIGTHKWVVRQAIKESHNVDFNHIDIIAPLGENESQVPRLQGGGCVGGNTSLDW